MRITTAQKIKRFLLKIYKNIKENKEYNVGKFKNRGCYPTDHLGRWISNIGYTLVDREKISNYVAKIHIFISLDGFTNIPTPTNKYVWIISALAFSLLSSLPCRPNRIRFKVRFRLRWCLKLGRFESRSDLFYFKNYCFICLKNYWFLLIDIKEI